LEASFRCWVQSTEWSVLHSKSVSELHNSPCRQCIRFLRLSIRHFLYLASKN